MWVFELPPRLSFKRYVSIESLYGTNEVDFEEGVSFVEWILPFINASEFRLVNEAPIELLDEFIVDEWTSLFEFSAFLFKSMVS